MKARFFLLLFLAACAAERPPAATTLATSSITADTTQLVRVVFRANDGKFTIEPPVAPAPVPVAKPKPVARLIKKAPPKPAPKKNGK